MPQALYSLDDGEIFTILYKLPSGQKQIAAATLGKNRAFIYVPEGITPHNSMIDLETGAAIPTGPKMTYLYRYHYNPVSGHIFAAVEGNVPDGHPMLETPNMIVSDKRLDHIDAGFDLQLDDVGVPVMDDAGKHIATRREPPVPLPTAEDLILQGMVNAGMIPFNNIPEPLLIKTNASLAVAALPTIDSPPADAVTLKTTG